MAATERGRRTVLPPEAQGQLPAGDLLRL